MLDVLLESRSRKPRRLAGTIASGLLHAALISAAIAVARPTRGGAVTATRRDSTVIYVVPPAVKRSAPQEQRIGRPPTNPRLPNYDRVLEIPIAPPVELRGPVIADTAVCRDCTTGAATGSSITTGVVAAAPIGTGVMDVHDVDRAPRLIGRPIEPRYPATLREAGVQGRVIVQFVVDTLGRAEVGDLQVIQSPHVLFTESVREALARYRFVPGEAGGRRVPTRVQIPFDFKLR